MAVMRVLSALVDVRTACTVTGVATIARAGIGAICIGTDCVDRVAVIKPLIALVDVLTVSTVAGPSCVTNTSVRTCCVGTSCLLVASLKAGAAFVDV